VPVESGELKQAWLFNHAFFSRIQSDRSVKMTRTLGASTFLSAMSAQREQISLENQP
jgi:hypothetical protein